jgi:hypothetical protein
MESARGVAISRRDDSQSERGVDRDNVQELGVPRMQSAKTVGKTYME